MSELFFYLATDEIDGAIVTNVLHVRGDHGLPLRHNSRPGGTQHDYIWRIYRLLGHATRLLRFEN